MKSSSFDENNILFALSQKKHEKVSDKHVKHLIHDKKISKKMYLKDHIWNLGVRLNINRDDYKVPPGLYKIGEPTPDDDVVVSGNYKLTFDHVRKNLNGNYWLLILDTDGINVWCAAGKGTFGTVELVYALKKNRVSEVVNHKRLILPQLSAPGIQSPLVEKISGFKIYYGPVHVKDLDNFVDRNYKKTPMASQVQFNLWDRLTVLPLEWSKPTLVLILLSILFRFISFLDQGLIVFPIIGVLVGVFILPIILPFRPFRMFYLNGLVLTLTFSIFYMTLQGFTFINIGASLLASVWSGYLAYKFTGSTTFTSLSGVKEELKQALPIFISVSSMGILFIIIGLIKGVVG